MEEKRRKKQDEKKKKDSAQKKTTEQKTKVPDSAKPSPVLPVPPGPAVPPPTTSSSSSSGNGLGPPAGGPSPQTAAPPQRYAAREVPPRFRQHGGATEHKQLLKTLLKRGQPLPLPLANAAISAPVGQAACTATAEQHTSSSLSSSSSSSSSLQTELPVQSCQVSQYDDSPLWGAPPHSPSASPSRPPAAWDPLIIDRTDTEAWPSITQSQAPPVWRGGGCSCSDTDPAATAASMSTNGQTTGLYPTGHPGSKTASSSSSAGPGPANHPGAGMQAAANRSWGSAHCAPPPQSSMGGDGKNDPPMGGGGGGGGGRGWGSSLNSAPPNFNLNLNPNANPSAWPVLGHDGPGGLGPNPNNPNAPLLSQSSPPQANNNNNASTGALNANGDNPPSSSSSWGEPADPPSSNPPSSSSSTNVSFSSEPQNLNSDGPNHHGSKQQQQQEAGASPVRGGGSNMSGWGRATGSPVGRMPPGATQVNGDDGSSVWGSNGDSSKAAPSSSSSKEPGSGWESGSGWGPRGSSGGWGEQAQASGGDWGKQQGGGEAPGGWDAPGSPAQDQQVTSWSRAPSAAGGACSEGSEGSADGRGGPGQRGHHSPPQPPLLPAPDLDPRVLCNSGWGQTPVRQHTSWDTAAEANRKREASKREASKREASTESWSSGPSSSPNEPQGGPQSAGMASHQRPDSGGKNNNDGPGGAAPQGWGGSSSMAAPNQHGSGWGELPGSKKPSNGPGGWGNNPPPPPGAPNNNVLKNGGQSWGEEKPTGWEDTHNNKAKPQGWGEPTPKAPHGCSSGGGGDWGEPGDGKKSSPANPSWDGEAGGWKDPPGPRGWGGKPPAPGPGAPGGGGGGGWGESVSQRPPVAPAQSWGGKALDGPNGTGTGGGAGGAGGSVGSWGGPGSVKQSAGGWSGSAKQQPDPLCGGGEPTGWEEPSPPSIRRKMEIDDGTAAWGDPGAHNKAVNLWDRNNPGGGSQGKPTPGVGGSNAPGPGNNHPHPHPHSHPHPYHGPPPPHQNHGHTPQNPGPMEPPAPHQAGPPHGRPPLMAKGWGEMSSGHGAKEEGGSSWGEAVPPPLSVDNGTAAWGKSTTTGGSCGGWGDGGPDGGGGGGYSRGNPPPMGSAACKSAVKPMQDGWGGGGGGGEDLQWDADDGDMWSSTSSSQENNNTPCNSWSNANKKGQQKVKVPGKQQQEEAWVMNRLIKQLTDMGFPRDPAEEALKSNNLNLDAAMSALLEKKTERGGMGGMGPPPPRPPPPPPPRPPLLSKDPSSDPRSPFMDKIQGGMFGSSSSSAAAQVRLAMQQHQAAPPPPQPPVPPPHGSSSQPNLRTASSQVPQFLSPQVQAQLLQFAAKNIGLNPALLTSPINPQHMTLLNQLYQLQLAYQRLQIQQQMLQAQRNVSGPIRQQEQQVARTINNMQQQIQQHQRQLAQALLMKQQQSQAPGQGPHTAAGLHPGQAKSVLDSFPGHPQAPQGLNDLHTKEQQSSPNAYSPYSNLSGLNPNMNVSCMEVGGLSLKEPPLPQPPQSRLSQWTHANAMDSLSGSSSPLEPSLQNKHGANLGAPVKPPQLEDSYGPYSMMSSSESPTSPLLAPDSWGPQGKNNNDKMANGTNINWPPEFCPGVPWKGLQSIDPETDPNATPGSVPSGPTINTNIQDVNRYLMRDRSGGSSPSSSQSEALPPDCDWPVSDLPPDSDWPVSELPPDCDWPVSAYSSSFSLSSPETDDAGKLSDMKSTWSPGVALSHGQASLSHELWKVPPQGGPRGGGPGGSTPAGGGAPSRPPPGLTGSKPPSSTWGGNALGLSQGWSSSYSSAGTAWSTDSSSRTSSWLVLRNLTPQIDGSTLRTLCMQHGPLVTFHLNLTQGNAMMRYSSRDEAAKAQKSLHMCVLGNTTILAEFAGEEEVNRFFAQGQSLPGGGTTSSWQAASPATTNQTRMGVGVPASHHPSIGQSPHWNNNNNGVAKAGGGDLGWGGGGVQQYSSLWGPPGGDGEARVMGSPTPINTLLPGDLLSGESM